MQPPGRPAKKLPTLHPDRPTSVGNDSALRAVVVFEQQREKRGRDAENEDDEQTDVHLRV